MKMSLRARLSVFYAVVLVIVLCSFAAEIWWVEGRLGLGRVDRELDGLSATVANLIAAEMMEEPNVASAALEAARAVAVPDRAVAIFATDGRSLASSGGGLEWRGSVPRSSKIVRTVKTPAGPWRIRAHRQAFGDTTIVLLVGSSLKDVERQQHEVVEIMWVAIPIVLLLAGGGGFWIAAWGLRPIVEMARQSTRITTAGTETLGNTGRSDEVGQLATAFNGLLARLRAALQTQRQFMADASHELRTPVSVVRAAAEVALSRPERDGAEYRETLTIVGNQARRLSRLVESMLVLARGDAGGYPLQPVDLYLDEIVSDCCRTLRVLCEQRGVTIRTRDRREVPFRGDEDLLRQMVLNLLQNAVQYTVPGGTVTVDLASDPHCIEISVTDKGPGIAPPDQRRVFERFVRLDTARAGDGAGLGLPIAKWIAEAHGGTLVLSQSSPEGSTFSVSLPYERRS